jgi:hypothetical protein
MNWRQILSWKIISDEYYWVPLLTQYYKEVTGKDE